MLRILLRLSKVKKMIRFDKIKTMKLGEMAEYLRDVVVPIQNADSVDDVIEWLLEEDEVDYEVQEAMYVL